MNGIIELSKAIRSNRMQSDSLQSEIAGRMLNATRAELVELYEEGKTLRAKQAKILARIKHLEATIHAEDPSARSHSTGSHSTSSHSTSSGQAGQAGQAGRGTK
jgi:chromosome segregation ATPase